MQLERQHQIINLLLQSTAPLTIDTIAKQLQVCNKTIRNDLKDIAELISGSELVLQSTPGIGVTLQGNDEEKLRLGNRLPTNNAPVDPASNAARKEYIIRRLLLREQRVTIRDIASELYLSRASVYKDLASVQDWLKRFNLNLRKKSSQGIEVIGKEGDWRSAVARLLDTDRKTGALTVGIVESSQRIDKRTLQKMTALVDLDYGRLEQLLTEMETRLNLHFSDEAFTSFVIHVAIAIKRLKAQKDIRLADSVLSELKQKEEYGVAAQLAQELESLFEVQIPDSEIGYILLHILGARTQTSHCQLDINFPDECNAAAIAKEIIRISQHALRVNLSDDAHLLKGLILHLRPAINRLKYGLTLKNPILDEIKQNYPELYGAAWMTSIVFERYLGVRAGEEEIGYIALHLGAALERARKPLRALIVCTSGIGTSELIAARLNRCFNDVEIVDVLSTTALRTHSLEAIDVIISTVPVETSKPVITVSPLLTQNDIKLLAVCFEKIRAKTKTSAIPLAIEHVQPMTGLASREKIIRHICSRLQQLGFVSSAFVRDALQREKIASTYLGNLSALPHASPQFAKLPVLAVCRLQNPVDWGGAPVDFILLLVLPEDSSDGVKQFLRALYRKLCYPEFIEKLRQSECTADIIHEMEGVLC